MSAAERLGARAGRRPPVLPDLCKRVRHRQSECRLCAEICPEQAIALRPGPVLSERCIGCGLCQSVCPTEVFQDATHTDALRLAALRAPAGRERGGRGARTSVSVHCRQVEPAGEGSVEVFCLGVLTEGFLLGATASAEPGDLVLEKGDCARCAERRGGELFDTAVAAHRALARGLGPRRGRIAVREGRTRGPARLSRRALLRPGGPRDAARASAPTGSLASGPASAPLSSPAPPAPGARRPSPARSLLRELLHELGGEADATVPSRPGWRWGRLTIDARGCATCGICVNLCPTGAITRTVEADRLSHVFDAGRCTRCGLCREACPEQVIEFAPGVRLGEVARSAPRAITAIELHRCRVCGDTIPPKEGDACATCRKRGLAGRRVPGHRPGPLTGG